MKLRSQTLTSLRALLDLSLHAAPGRPASLAEIARRQGLSAAFLEQLFRRLKRSGLVAPWRGMKGGYTLARDPRELSLLDVFRALDDPLAQPQPAGGEPAAAEEAVLREVFASLEGKLEEALGSVSLADLKAGALAHPGLEGMPRPGAGFSI